jgi:DNA polymerase-1
MIPITFDVETAGGALYHQGARVFAYSLCDARGSTDVYRFDRTATRRAKGERVLRQVWNDDQVAKVGHNILFDIGATVESGYPLPEGTPIHDTQLMSKILRNLAPTHALDMLAWELCGYSRELDIKVKRLTPGGLGYERVPEPIMDAYQRADAERTMLLYHTFWPYIKENPGFLDEYNTELALTWATRRIIKRGLYLRQEETHKLVARLEQEIKAVLRQICGTLGRTINPRGEDMRKLLFEELKLPVIKRSEKTGKPSMDKEVFATWEQDPEVEHPVLDMVLKYRSYTYSLPIIQSYLKFANTDGLIHPGIYVSQADTGRQAVENPNMQNVQKPGVLTNRFPVPARHLFGPKYDYVWFLIDYAGQEALLLVHYSGDRAMLEIVNTQGPGAIHDAGAVIAYRDDFSLCPDPVRKKGLRHNVKGAMSFGIPYGSSDKTACLNLQLPPAVGMPRLREYRSKFAKYCNLTNVLMDQVRRLGYIETAFGRRLYVPRDMPYAATNYLIQGTGAGMLKRAQVKVDKYLEDMTGGAAGIVLPIHDEIVIEWPRDMLPQAPAMLRDIAELMCDFGDLFTVEFTVECRVATCHWADTKEVDIYGTGNAA